MIIIIVIASLSSPSKWSMIIITCEWQAWPAEVPILGQGQDGGQPDHDYLDLKDKLWFVWCHHHHNNSSHDHHGLDLQLINQLCCSAKGRRHLGHWHHHHHHHHHHCHQNDHQPSPSSSPSSPWWWEYLFPVFPPQKSFLFQQTRYTRRVSMRWK